MHCYKKGYLSCPYAAVAVSQDASRSSLLCVKFLTKVQAKNSLIGFTAAKFFLMKFEDFLEQRNNKKMFCSPEWKF